MFSTYITWKVTRFYFGGRTIISSRRVESERYSKRFPIARNDLLRSVEMFAMNFISHLCSAGDCYLTFLTKQKVGDCYSGSFARRLVG